MTENIYIGTKRKPLTAKQRLQLFYEKKGKCCLCAQPINGVREMWDEHLVPLIDGGSNDLQNRDIAHRKCAQLKTAREATSRGKLRRAAEKHFGAKRSQSIMPGSKRSQWKRKMDGSVIRRSS